MEDLKHDAILNCLLEGIPAIMESFAIHEHAAISFTNILRDMLENLKIVFLLLMSWKRVTLMII